MLTRAYTPIHQWFGGDEALISIVGSNAVMIGTFWLVNAALLYTDLTGRPGWMAKYKVQKGQNVPLDKAKLKKALKTVVFNNLVVNILVSFPMYYAQKRVGCTFSLDDVPSASRIIQDLIVYMVIQEIIFYYSHRLLHHPSLYRRVHKKHHEWTAPIGIISVYASLAEYLTGNAASVLLGPLVTRSHIVTHWMWYAIATLGTSVHHSGYHLPFLASPEFHDYHHLTFNWNYGTFGILDWLHGTDVQWRETVQFHRHRTLLTLTPMSVTYPDDGQYKHKDMDKKRG